MTFFYSITHIFVTNICNITHIFDTNIYNITHIFVTFSTTRKVTASPRHI